MSLMVLGAAGQYCLKLTFEMKQFDARYAHHDVAASGCTITNYTSEYARPEDERWEGCSATVLVQYTNSSVLGWNCTEQMLFDLKESAYRNGYYEFHYRTLCDANKYAPGNVVGCKVDPHQCSRAMEQGTEFFESSHFKDNTLAGILMTVLSFVFTFPALIYFVSEYIYPHFPPFLAETPHSIDWDKVAWFVAFEAVECGAVGFTIHQLKDCIATKKGVEVFMWLALSLQLLNLVLLGFVYYLGKQWLRGFFLFTDVFTVAMSGVCCAVCGDEDGAFGAIFGLAAIIAQIVAWDNMYKKTEDDKNQAGNQWQTAC